MNQKEKVRQQIIKALTEGQVTDCDRFTRSEEYKGYYLNDDDAPLYTYAHIAEETQRPVSMLKELVKEMRDEGLVQLIPAVDQDYQPSGSGWSLTQKGMEYAVDNDLVVI